jgi:hypothetical protein
MHDAVARAYCMLAVPHRSAILREVEESTGVLAEEGLFVSPRFGRHRHRRTDRSAWHFSCHCSSCPESHAYGRQNGPRPTGGWDNDNTLPREIEGIGRKGRRGRRQHIVAQSPATQSALVRGLVTCSRSLFTPERIAKWPSHHPNGGSHRQKALSPPFGLPTPAGRCLLRRAADPGGYLPPISHTSELAHPLENLSTPSIPPRAVGANSLSSGGGRGILRPRARVKADGLAGFGYRPEHNLGLARRAGARCLRAFS